jgi:voltage-dependent potassium channel beta subunit
MLYRRLGRTGLPISALGLGSWVTFGNQVGRSEARELVAQAFDAGINFFDSAESYADGAAEQLLGDVIHDNRLPRDAYLVSSKAFFGRVPEPKPTQRGLSAKHLRDACDQALKRLRVEYLDLFYCHRPDPDCPVEETVWAMHQLVQAGKVLYWGTSEWPAERIAQALAFARGNGLRGPSMEQPEYHLLARARMEQEYAHLFAEHGLGSTTWSPLAMGVLTGKYREGVPQDSRFATTGYEWLQRRISGEEGERNVRRADRFVALAQQWGMAPAPLAIAWCLSNPNVSSVILGASSRAQLSQNLGALELLPRLDAESLRALAEAVA